jgi:4-amino-4-deoxy-L-arabinose transferase-like glycosyltransferase
MTLPENMQNGAVFGLERRDWVLLAVLLVASRWLYHALGLTFDATPFPYFMQFIDPELLLSRLLESLWYYHANPPLLNLLAGVGIKVFGMQAPLFWSAVFHFLGALTAVSVYVLAWRLSGTRVAAAIATALLVFSPSFVLYENWFMYSFPTVALLTLSALLLYAYARTGRTAWCVGFFASLALLLLMRSLFHLAWMGGVVVLLAAASPGRRRQVLVASLVPLLVVAGWYGKNLYYFGKFGASTWLGLGLSNITTLVATREELQPLVASGELSQFALVSRYLDKDALFALPHPPTGIAVLDQVRKGDGSYNFNNIRIVSLDRYYTADAIAVARHFPGHYLRGWSLSNRLYFSPSSMNLYFSAENRRAARPMERLLNPVLYGTGGVPQRTLQPHFGFATAGGLEVNTSLPLLLAWFVLLGYGALQARRGLASGAPADRPRAIVFGYIVVAALYLYVVGTAFELAENYRYRYNVEPLMFVLATAAIVDAVRRLRARRGRGGH